MRATRITVKSALGLSLLVLGLKSANADLPADTIGQTTLAFPAEAHRAFIVDVEFESFAIGRITVVDPDNKRILGMIPTGFAAPSALSHDGKTIYTADIWYSRGTRGNRTDVLAAWDSSTLSPAWEVLIPNKRAQMLTQRYGLKTSSDDRFVYIYNFTPSTSVTVVDTQSKAVVGEIAIPGCVLNYPVGKRRFASLCGDGSVQVVTINEQGQESARSRTPFFDPNAEKLVERAVNVGDTYYFTTTTGTVRPVDFAGDAPIILPSWSLITEAEKKDGWAPGGWQLMAIAPKLNRLYVLMHDSHEPMKWEDPSQLIWAYDLKTQRKIATLEAPIPMWSLQATGDDKPVLLGSDIEGGLQIFDLKTNQLSGSMKKVAKTATQIMTY
ncbi:amine dehydrogenase [Pseudomonas sp. P7]|uniref:amine dehydrogenase large subunit n=1 Tax=Pseudomonas TaxID=286 RepID=UPI0015EC846D|nr:MULTISPECIES: amine dehydrogenase large subunit [Pseudomonas]MBA2922869.1 amine dehydrogenase [Pseudomonas sivasensis]MBP5950081.1 amine dehydrogenase [Pseudomonas sp. P42]